MSPETTGAAPDESTAEATLDETAAGACCSVSASIDEGAALADVEVLSALGNDTRYEIVRRISAADAEVCVCDLQAAVGVSQSAVSQALSRLSSAGLVSRRKEGSWRYYRTTEAAEALLSTLDSVGRR